MKQMNGFAARFRKIKAGPKEAAFWIKRRAYRGYRRVRNGLVELRRRGDESSKGWMPMPEFEKRLAACRNDTEFYRLIERPDVPLHLHGIHWKDDVPYRIFEQTLIDRGKGKRPHPKDMMFEVPKAAEPLPSKQDVPAHSPKKKS